MSQQQTTTQNAVGDAALPVIRIGVVILHLLFLASLWYSAWFDKLQHPKLPTLQVTLVTLPETILADQIPQGPDMAQPPPPDAVIEAAPLPEPAAAIEPVSPDVPDHVAGVEAVPPPPVEALPPPAPEPAPPPEPVPPPEAAVVPEPAIVPEPAPPLPPEPKPEPKPEKPPKP